MDTYVNVVLAHPVDASWAPEVGLPVQDYPAGTTVAVPVWGASRLHTAGYLVVSPTPPPVPVLDPLDHGADLTGLGDDDHPQYLTTGRGDARYAATAHAHAAADVPHGHTLDSLSDVAVDPMAVVEGQALVYAAGQWQPGGAEAGLHAASHAATGADPITPAAIGAADAGHNHDTDYAAATHTHDYAATGHTHTVPALDDLSDVNTAAVMDGQTIVYQAGSWVPGAAGGGGTGGVAHAASHGTGGGDPITPAAIGASPASHVHTAADVGAATTGHTHPAAALNDLSDVAVAAPAAGQVVRHDGTGWGNATLTPADAGAAPAGHTHTGYAADTHTHPAGTLDSLTDVATTGAADGQALVFQAGQWGPATVSGGGTGGVTDHGALTGLADDDHAAVYPRYTIGPAAPAAPRRGDLWLVTA